MTDPTHTYDTTAALASLAQPEDFIMVQVALIDALDGDHLAAILFARIAYRCRFGPYRATYTDLAADTRLSEPVIRRRLKDLRAAGLLTAEPAGGFDRAMVYTVPDQPTSTDPDPDPIRSNRQMDSAPEDASSVLRDPMDSASKDGSSLSLEVRTTNRKEEPLAPLAATDDPASSFEAFWSAYPRKTSKGHARRAWTTATKNTPPERILAAVAAQRPVLASTDPRFIPHPATWLNGERWLDTAPKARDPRVPEGWGQSAVAAAGGRRDPRVPEGW